MTTRINRALKLSFHAPHFSCLCSVFFHVHRGTYAPIGVDQVIIIIIIYCVAHMAYIPRPGGIFLTVTVPQCGPGP